MKTTFIDTTEDQFHHMLDILPPAVYCDHGFLVGEPVTHRPCSITGNYMPVYDAYIHLNNRYRVSNEPITVREFKALTMSEALA